MESESHTDVLNATLIDRRDLNDTLSVIRIRIDGGRAPVFNAGQHISLGQPMAPSPDKRTTGRSGKARRAAIAPGTPHPTTPLAPQVNQWVG